MRVLLQTLGCRLNEAELETWSREFQELGYEITDRPELADLVVVNTCAVTDEAVRKSRKLVNRAQRRNPRAKLVVSGCHSSLEQAAGRSIAGVDLVVDNRRKENLVKIAREHLELPLMPQSALEPGAPPLLARGRQRAFVKVQDGCHHQCTFCIVTLARGEERSRAAETVVQQIRALHAEGIQEAVLAGVHLGGYGRDTGSSLTQLIAELLERTEIPRLRLGAVEPWGLDEGFWALFENPRLMPHLHLPLQSGSDPVLKRMARRCKVAEFLRLVERARAVSSDFNITTDVIVGFPGETEADWRATLDAVRQAAFGHLHIFGFSARPGTRAAQMPDPTPAEVIRERSRELHALGEQLKRTTLERFVGRTFPVLIEDRAGDGGAFGGYTPNFLRVALNSDTELSNRILDLELAQLTPKGDALWAAPSGAPHAFANSSNPSAEH